MASWTRRPRLPWHGREWSRSDFRQLQHHHVRSEHKRATRFRRLPLCRPSILFYEHLEARVLAYRIEAWIGQKTLFDLRVRVFRHIERQRLGFFDKTPIGTLITRATSDVEALARKLMEVR